MLIFQVHAHMVLLADRLCGDEGPVWLHAAANAQECAVKVVGLRGQSMQNGAPRDVTVLDVQRQLRVQKGFVLGHGSRSRRKYPVFRQGEKNADGVPGGTDGIQRLKVFTLCTSSYTFR